MNDEPNCIQCGKCCHFVVYFDVIVNDPDE